MTNDKASRREDDQRKHEEQPLLRGAPVEGRTEARLVQDTEDLEPGRRPLTGEPSGEGASIDEVNRKSDFGRWFRPSEFPADARRLQRSAQEEGAPDWVIDSVARLEPDTTFATVGEAWEAAKRS